MHFDQYVADTDWPAVHHFKASLGHFVVAGVSWQWCSGTIMSGRSVKNVSSLKCDQPVDIYHCPSFPLGKWARNVTNNKVRETARHSLDKEHWLIGMNILFDQLSHKLWK